MWQEVTAFPRPKWHRFNQQDTHKDILPPRKDGQYQRRHTQVYLDADNYQW